MAAVDRHEAAARLLLQVEADAEAGDWLAVEIRNQLQVYCLRCVDRAGRLGDLEALARFDQLVTEWRTTHPDIVAAMEFFRWTDTLPPMEGG